MPDYSRNSRSASGSATTTTPFVAASGSGKNRRRESGRGLRKGRRASLYGPVLPSLDRQRGREDVGNAMAGGQRSRVQRRYGRPSSGRRHGVGRGISADFGPKFLFGDHFDTNPLRRGPR